MLRKTDTNVDWDKVQSLIPSLVSRLSVAISSLPSPKTIEEECAYVEAILAIAASMLCTTLGLITDDMVKNNPEMMSEIAGSIAQDGKMVMIEKAMKMIRESN